MEQKWPKSLTTLFSFIETTLFRVR